MANTETLLIVFIAITGLAVLLQACVLLGLWLTVRKAVKAANEQANEYRSKLIPIIDNSSQLLTSGTQLIGSVKDLVSATQTLVKNIQTPVQSAVTEVESITRDVHAQALQLQASVDEVAQKARRQADRVDNMATSFLDGLERVGGFLNEVVHMPVRQVNGVIAAAKAVVDTLRSPRPSRPRSRPTRVAEDKDLFV
jgi:methyl-accepting chemotaxis protein